MSDDDLIRRGDALAAIQLGDTVTKMQARIRAITPAVTQPAPDAAFASGFKAGLRAAAEHWFRGVSGVRQLLPETKAQILAIPCPQPAPDALPRCAECSCDDGDCEWIATDDDSYPYDAIEQCERDLDGVEDEPVVNKKLRTMHQEYLQAIAEGRLVTDAVSPTDAMTEQLDAGGVKEAWEKAYWRMRSYAVHDNDCKLNKPPRFDGPCSCGLTAALEEALALLTEGTIRKSKTVADDWECPIGAEGCHKNCGSYGCGN